MHHMLEHLWLTSPVGNHIIQCTNCSSGNVNDLFTILKQCNNNINACAMETIFIERQQPILNVQLSMRYYEYKLKFT